MPMGTREFNHYSPSEFLVRNPMLLDGASTEVVATLDKFEEVIVALNGCL